MKPIILGTIILTAGTTISLLRLAYFLTKPNAAPWSIGLCTFSALFWISLSIWFYKKAQNEHT